MDISPDVGIYVVGVGVMSQGILRHLGKRYSEQIHIISRHLAGQSISDYEIFDLTILRQKGRKVILSFSSNDEKSSEVWRSPEVIRAISSDSTLCIELGTVSANRMKLWHEDMGELGAECVEAPVTGSRWGAEAGNLSVFRYSADPSTAKEFMSTFSAAQYEFSTPCAPTKFKLVYNAWGAAILASVREYWAQMRELLSDNDIETARAVVENSGWMSLVCKSQLRWAEELKPHIDFLLRHMVKDLNYHQKLCGSLQQGLTNLVFSMYQDALLCSEDSADLASILFAGGGTRK